MKFNGRIRRTLVILAGVAALTACVQPRVQQSQAGEAVAEDEVSLLTNQLESLQKYASRMEQIYAAQEAEILSPQRYASRMDQIYAAQEAEILSLQRQVASMSPRQRP